MNQTAATSRWSALESLKVVHDLWDARPEFNPLDHVPGNEDKNRPRQVHGEDPERSCMWRVRVSFQLFPFGVVPTHI